MWKGSFMFPRRFRHLRRVRHLRFFLTNWRLRLLVGSGLLLLICIQCARPSGAQVQDNGLVRSVSGQEVGSLSDAQSQKLERLARHDPTALLDLCLEHTRSDMHDFTCTFIKQERIDGVLGATQEIDVKFLARPFSVAMSWTKNAPVSDRLLYVEGLYDNNLLLRPKGMLSWMGTVRRKPDSPQVMANTLHPVTMFSFERSLETMVRISRQAAARHELGGGFAGYKDVAGRVALVIERQLPARDGYPAAKTLVCIDPRLLIPIAIESWDWDGQLISRYIYKDVRMNVGLSLDDFTPQANGL
jgi:hypothetical protein